ncbi:cytochrome P450 [Podospora australis]|uniref:Cytochrome P450 n=1 Tax=Podospora australis TaxID=1536484 RepID=A0AAN7ACN5_9PEZI|nr:cytochrome P450 [Podospora australis]
MDTTVFEINTRVFQFWTAASLIGLCLSLWFWGKDDSKSAFPLVGADENDSTNYGKAAQNFARDSYSILSKAMKKYQGPFRVASATGVKIVLPTRYLEDIKSDDRFSFAHEMAKQSLSHLPGFEAFATPLHNNIFQDTIKIKITQSLGAITESLAEETSLSLHQLIGDKAEWHELQVSKTVLDLTTRLSTRVFLGAHFSRDEKWLNLALAYTMTAFQASQTLLKWPVLLQRAANMFLPICVGQRAMLGSIRAMIEPEIAKRRKHLQGNHTEKQKGTDTLDWMDEIAQGRPFDLVLGQLQLNFVAIHTTSTLMTDVLLDLCTFPEYVPKLREEVIEVLKENGWKKTAMYKLKRMDSFIKEVLRLRPQSMITARRMTTDDVIFSDGVQIPRGSSIMVPTIVAGVDPKVYPNPDRFDGERFFRMRTAEKDDPKAQLVTVSAEYLGFGYGKHACPGRFLAAHEIKVALCHLLLKYEIKFLDGQEGKRPASLAWETAYMTDPSLKIMIRRRKEELDLDNLHVSA